jgi:hypothetical protein
MVAFDVAYELTLGILCASVAGGARGGLVLSLAVYVPIAAVGLFLWPGWQAMYLVDLDASPLRLAMFGLLQSVVLVSAYLVGVRLARLRVARSWIVLGAAWLVLLAILFVGLRRRAFTVTTFSAFHARAWSGPGWGGEADLLGGPVMTFLGLAGLVNLGALAVHLRALRAGTGKDRRVRRLKT